MVLRVVFGHITNIWEKLCKVLLRQHSPHPRVWYKHYCEMTFILGSCKVLFGSLQKLLYNQQASILSVIHTHTHTHTHTRLTLSLRCFSERIDFDLSGVDFEEQIIESLNLICSLWQKPREPLITQLHSFESLYKPFKTTLTSLKHIWRQIFIHSGLYCTAVQ